MRGFGFSFLVFLLVVSSVCTDELNESLHANLYSVEPAAAAPSSSSSFGSSVASFFGFGSNNNNSNNVPQQAAQAPAAMPPQARNLHVPPKRRARRARRSGRKIRREVDTNVVAVRFDTLAANAAELFAGDPVFCGSCNAAFTNSSKLQRLSELKEADQKQAAKLLAADDESQADPANDQADSDGKQALPEDDDSTFWKCEYCGKVNQVDLDPEEIPQTDSRDYVLEPAQEEKGDSKTGDNSEDVIFVIDTSGSMCVTTEVPGNIRLKGMFSTLANGKKQQTNKQTNNQQKNQKTKTKTSHK